jgi:hypothetical protein
VPSALATPDRASSGMIRPGPMSDYQPDPVPDYASSGIVRSSTEEVGNLTAGLGPIPLQDQGNPSRSSGRNLPDNTTIHESERENSGAPGLEAGFTYDNGRYDHDIDYRGDRDDEFGGREHDDRNYDPQPLQNDDVYDQTGPTCAAESGMWSVIIRSWMRLSQRSSEKPG